MREAKRMLTIALLYIAILALAVAVLGSCRTATTPQVTTNNKAAARATRARDSVTAAAHETIYMHEVLKLDTLHSTTDITRTIIRHATARMGGTHDTTTIIRERDTIQTITNQVPKQSLALGKKFNLLAAVAAIISVFIVIVLVWLGKK